MWQLERTAGKSVFWGRVVFQAELYFQYLNPCEIAYLNEVSYIESGFLQQLLSRSYSVLITRVTSSVVLPSANLM